MSVLSRWWNRRGVGENLLRMRNSYLWLGDEFAKKKYRWFDHRRKWDSNLRLGDWYLIFVFCGDPVHDFFGVNTCHTCLKFLLSLLEAFEKFIFIIYECFLLTTNDTYFYARIDYFFEIRNAYVLRKTVYFVIGISYLVISWLFMRTLIYGIWKLRVRFS